MFRSRLSALAAGSLDTVRHPVQQAYSRNDAQDTAGHGDLVLPPGMKFASIGYSSLFVADDRDEDGNLLSAVDKGVILPFRR